MDLIGNICFVCACVCGGEWVSRAGFSSKCKSLCAWQCVSVCMSVYGLGVTHREKVQKKKGKRGGKKEREGKVSAVISIRFIVVQFPVPPVLPEGDYITFHHSFIFSHR